MLAKFFIVYGDISKDKSEKEVIDSSYHFSINIQSLPVNGDEVSLEGL